MRNFLKHVYRLGLKEVKSFLNDKVFFIFVIWSFTLNIIVVSNAGNMDVKNASIAVVNEDNSQLSRNIIQGLREPFFKTPANITFSEIDKNMDLGNYTFVVVIPEHFEADLLSNKLAEIQLNIDATVISQAYIGSGYIKQIINKEVNDYINEGQKNTDFKSFDNIIRVKYNPNSISEWFMSIAQVITMGTMLSMMLPAVALVREKESGTIEHLLVMPITPQEIMLSKIWSNALIILLFTMLSIQLVIKGYFGVKIEGFILLFFMGFIIFQFSVTSLGILLATFANNTAQLALLIILVMMPMVFLSGMYTPMESMAPIIQDIMFLSPLKHCMDFAFAVIFRGTTILEIWKPILWMLGMGVSLFIISSLRFNRWFNSSNR